MSARFLRWRHAVSVTPTATYALAGGNGFSVVGAPIASDMIGLRAGSTSTSAMVATARF